MGLNEDSLMKPMPNLMVIIYIKINFIMFFIIVDTPTFVSLLWCILLLKKKKKKNYDKYSIAYPSPQLMMT